MKKRFVIINALMSVVILFAILFQSVHSYDHLVKELTEKKCLHKHFSSTEITHSHKFEKCFICDFGFSNFINIDVLSFKHYIINGLFGYSFNYSKQITNYFKGSLFALRAPPYFIV